MKTIKIFLASSYELKVEREQFEIFINRKNKEWLKSHNIFLHLDIWEDFIDAMSQTRLQDEYNKVIKDCDIFVLLVWNKVGKYTAEEFENAFGQFKETKKPFIYTYFKTPHTTQERNDLQSLWAFMDKLNSLGHFKTDFTTIDGLKFHFSNQLDKLFAIEFSKSDKPIGNDQRSPLIQVSNSKNVVIKNVHSGGSFILGDNNTIK